VLPSVLFFYKIKTEKSPAHRSWYNFGKKLGGAMAGETKDEVYACPKCIVNILAMPENRGMPLSQLRIKGNVVKLNGHSYTVGQIVPCRDGLSKTTVLGFNNIDNCGHFLTPIEMQSLLADFSPLTLNIRQPS